MPTSPHLSGYWNFSLFDGQALGRNPGYGCVSDLWAAPLPAAYSKWRLRRKKLKRSEANARTFARALQPSTSNRWLGQDTCKAAQAATSAQLSGRGPLCRIK